MLISKKEMERRYAEVVRVMKENDLKAIFFVGDRMPGNSLMGDFQFFTNNYVLNYRQCVIMFPDSEPVLLSGGWIQTQSAARNCWIKDLRQIDNADALFATIPSVLKEKGVTSGRVGTNFDHTSMAVAQAVRNALPEVELVEIHHAIVPLRQVHNEDERKIMLRCAELCDGAYEYIRGIIKPGVTENRIRSELDNYMIGNGAEDCFTLVASGHYCYDEAKNECNLPYTPDASMKEIKAGDTVVLEITPRYDCYWTQLVRFVSVGEENPDLQKVHDLLVKVIAAGAEKLKAGNHISAVADAMKECAAAITQEYKIGKLGHVTGLDLTEFGITSDCTAELTPGMTIVLHPVLHNANGKCPIFWGETYMITETGCNQIQGKDSKLYTV